MIPASTLAHEPVCVEVSIVDDGIAERREDFSVNLTTGSNTNVEVEGTQSIHTVDIEDDDGILK